VQACNAANAVKAEVGGRSPNGAVGHCPIRFNWEIEKQRTEMGHIRIRRAARVLKGGGGRGYERARGGEQSNRKAK